MGRAQSQPWAWLGVGVSLGVLGLVAFAVTLTKISFGPPPRAGAAQATLPHAEATFRPGSVCAAMLQAGVHQAMCPDPDSAAVASMQRESE